MHTRTITRTATLTRILVAAVLACLAVTVTVLLTAGNLEGGNLGPGSQLTSAGWYGIVQSAGLLFFAFAGYARIATLGEEVRDPQRTIPRAIPAALAITVAAQASVPHADIAVTTAILLLWSEVGSAVGAAVGEPPVPFPRCLWLSLTRRICVTSGRDLDERDAGEARGTPAGRERDRDRDALLEHRGRRCLPLRRPDS